METPSSICDTDIPLQLRNMDALAASYIKSLHSLQLKAQETSRCQVKLEELKANLREAEDNLVKALGVKTRREAKRMALMDAIASVKERVEDLKTSIMEQRTKNEEYATIVSQQRLVLAAYEEKSNESIEHDEETQEAISWYSRVLAFHVEGGHGVKFTFKNINVANPNEEYLFTIRYEDDTYTLLNCEPPLEDTKELIHELNKTNGLFKFVKIMRKRFQEAVAQGSSAMTANEHQESALISDSAPISSISTTRSYSPTKENEHQGEPKEKSTRRRVKSVLSPGSESSVRRSSRLKARTGSGVEDAITSF